MEALYRPPGRRVLMTATVDETKTGSQRRSQASGVVAADGKAAAGVLALYVLAWLAVPPILRAQLQKQGSELLGRQVTVAHVAFNPWTLELTLSGIAVADAAGRAPQLQIGRVYANAAVQSLWRLAPVIDALQVDAPVVRVAQTAAGKFDFDDIVQRFARLPEAPAQEPLRFALYNVRLQGGEVDFDDQTVHVRHELRAITLDLPFLSNLSADRQVKVLPKLAFEFDGSKFDSSAQATPFAQTHQAQARFRIQDFDLAPLAGYIPASLGIRLDAAKLDADLGLDFAEQGQAPEVRLTGHVRLGGVSVSGADEARLLAFDSLDVALGDVRPLQRQVELASVELHGPHVYLQRDASGRVQVPGQARGGEAVAQSSSPASSAAPWKFAIRQIELSDGALDWRDDSLHRPAAESVWQVRDWQAQVHDAAWPAQQPAQFSTALRLSGGAATGEPAKIEIQGQASDSGVQATATAAGVPVALAAPYLAQFIRPVVAGTLDATVSLEQEGEALTAKVQRLQLNKASVSCAVRKGCPTLREAGVAGAPPGEQWALGQLDMADATVDLRRRRVQIERVLLDAPQVLAARDKAGAWMFDDWLVPAPPAHAEPQDAAPPWAVAVRQLQLKDGTAVLRDAGARRPVALNLSALHVGVQDLALQGDRLPAFGLKVQARVGTGKADPGQLSWDGSLALAPELHAKGSVRAKNLPLQVVQAYLPDELN